MLEPSVQARLALAVSDPAERARVLGLLEACLRAHGDLAHLDDSLYARLAGGEGPVLEQAAAGGLLYQLAGATLGGLTRLLSLLSSQGYLAADGTDTTLPDELEFDLGAPPPVRDELGLDEGDIDGALDALAPSGQTRAQGAAELQRSARTIAYGLRSQLDAFRGRLDGAIAGGHAQHALEDLDDTRNATAEGVFALVQAVMGAYLPGEKAEAIITGHHSTLGRALVVRRGVADLWRSVDRDNWFLQDASLTREEHAGALERLQTTLRAFTSSEAFAMMRPADRWELVKVRRALEGGAPSLATRQLSEGLAKYLESLSSINQRDVLRRHDAEVLKELAEATEAARDVMTISLSGARDLARQALVLAARLYGRRRDLDVLLVRWRLTAPDLDSPVELGEVVAQLSQHVREVS